MGIPQNASGVQVVVRPVVVGAVTNGVGRMVVEWQQYAVMCSPITPGVSCMSWGGLFSVVQVGSLRL